MYWLLGVVLYRCGVATVVLRRPTAVYWLTHIVWRSFEWSAQSPIHANLRGNSAVHLPRQWTPGISATSGETGQTTRPTLDNTSSSAIPERPRCRVGQFWPKYKWETIFCSKRCRCQKTTSIDLFTRYPNSCMAALWTHQFSFIRKTVTLRFLSPFWGA